MITAPQTLIKAATDAWMKQLDRADKLLASYTDEQLAAEIAPGRNSGLYLLGHLTAVHDLMLPLLRLGEPLHPELVDPFIKHPDRSGQTFPSATALRNAWNAVSVALNKGIATLTPEEWMERHNSISPEDFEKEPHRNRFSVLLSRTAHLTEHIGQLLWVKK